MSIQTVCQFCNAVTQGNPGNTTISRSMGCPVSRPMLATVYVTNVGDYDTFVEATRNAGLNVGPEDWHYTKYGINIALETANHASAFLEAVRGFRIGDSRVLSRLSKRRPIMQSHLRIKWPVPSIHDIQVAFCDTYASAGDIAEAVQSRCSLCENRDEEREIYYDGDSDTHPSDSKMEEVEAFKTESSDGVKVENGDKIKPEIKSEVKSEGKLAVKDEHVDATKHDLAFRISTLANLPARVDVGSSS